MGGIEQSMVTQRGLLGGDSIVVPVSLDFGAFRGLAERLRALRNRMSRSISLAMLFVRSSICAHDFGGKKSWSAP